MHSCPPLQPGSDKQQKTSSQAEKVSKIHEVSSEQTALNSGWEEDYFEPKVEFCSIFLKKKSSDMFGKVGKRCQQETAAVWSKN